MAYDSHLINIVEFTRLYLAVFYSFVAIFYTVKIVLAKRSQKSELVFSGKPLTATWYNHMTFRLFRVLIWWVCVLRFFYPDVDSYLGVLPATYCSYSILLGNGLLAVGFASTLVVHFSLGSQWRSGIDPQGPQQLITHGFYRYSRNPMFVGIAIAQLGFFLALPSLFSLICLFLGLTILYRQTLSEERHLLENFPGTYPQYQAQVRRWL